MANKHPRVNILQPGCGVGGHCIAVDPYFIKAHFPLESKLIGTAREINNLQGFWCVEKIQNEILKFELRHKRKPVVALCGLALNPTLMIFESPASFIVEKIINSNDPSYFNIVEPNISFHNKFEIVKLEHAV